MIIPRTFPVCANLWTASFPRIILSHFPVNNHSECEAVLARGGNVAAVFSNIPASYANRPTFDGDQSDLRFLDPKGVVVALKAKGKAKKDTSGFVIQS